MSWCTWIPMKKMIVALVLGLAGCTYENAFHCPDDPEAVDGGTGGGVVSPDAGEDAGGVEADAGPPVDAGGDGGAGALCHTVCCTSDMMTCVGNEPWGLVCLPGTSCEASPDAGPVSGGEVCEERCCMPDGSYCEPVGPEGCALVGLVFGFLCY